MPGKSLIVALLAPLPFAVVPLLALFFSPGAGPGPAIVVRDAGSVTAPVVIETSLPLTLHAGEQSHTDCADASLSPIEG